MSPSKFLFQIIGLLLLFPGFFGLFVPHRGFPVGGSQIGNYSLLLKEHFGGLIDVLETGVILFAELTELSPAEEELRIEKRD
jgi:hypothetical protein